MDHLRKYIVMVIEAANRLDSVSEYYFSKKLRQIRQLNEDGHDIINLGIGSPDLPPDDTVIQRGAKDLKRRLFRPNIILRSIVVGTIVRR